MKIEVHPIDVDFAGWSIVEAGEHNAWGVIKDDTLVKFTAVKCAADDFARELGERKVAA